MAEAQDGRQALGGTAEAGARVQFSEWEQPCDQSDGGAHGEGKPGAGLDDAENEAKCKRGPPKTEQHAGACQHSADHRGAGPSHDSSLQVMVPDIDAVTITLEDGGTAHVVANTDHDLFLAVGCGRPARCRVSLLIEASAAMV